MCRRRLRSFLSQRLGGGLILGADGSPAHVDDRDRAGPRRPVDRRSDLRCPGSWRTGRQPMRRGRRPRRWPCESLPIGSSMGSRCPKKHAASSLSRDGLARDRAGAVVRALHRIGWTLRRQSGSHRTLARRRLAGFRVCFPRQGGNRAAHAGAHRPSVPGCGQRICRRTLAEAATCVARRVSARDSRRGNNAEDRPWRARRRSRS